MKIAKDANIKQTIVDWLKTVYTEGYEVDAGHYYTQVRMKDVGTVDLTFLKRRHVRIKGVDGVKTIGGGVAFNGRRDGAMLIHGGAKSDFGIFDEVELKRRIDTRFKKLSEDREERKKQEQVYREHIARIDPILTSYGYVKDPRYSWQSTWKYDNKVSVALQNGRGLSIDIYNGNISEEQALKIAKVLKETLSE